MELQEFRKEIDSIDRQITVLFQKRMELVRKIALLKREKGLPVLDTRREQEIIEAQSASVPPELSDDVKTLYQTVFALSRACQSSPSSERPEQTGHASALGLKNVDMEAQ